jgi:hypothetical protein
MQSACVKRAIAGFRSPRTEELLMTKSRTWLAVCHAKVVVRKQVLYRRTPTRLTPPFKLPPAL